MRAEKTSNRNPQQSLFTVALAATFTVWSTSEKTLSVHSIFLTRRASFYWLTVLFTIVLGTAAGDLVAEAYFVFHLNAVLAFWIAYILARPLVASTVDLPFHSVAEDGLGLGTTGTSVLFLPGILRLVFVLTRRSQQRMPGSSSENSEKAHAT